MTLEEVGRSHTDMRGRNSNYRGPEGEVRPEHLRTSEEANRAGAEGRVEGRAQGAKAEGG